MPGLGSENGQDMDMMEEDFMRKREEMQNVAKDRVVVVDNLPKIGSEKFKRLMGKLVHDFEEIAPLQRDDENNPRLILPCDDNGSTLGFAFAEYHNPEDAHKAIISLHNRHLDKAHQMWACTAGALERLQAIPEEFVPPPKLPVTNTIGRNFKSWLLDERGRDQFMIRHQDDTSIFWHDHIIKPQLDFARMGWTENRAVWSPRGTYIATFHRQGIKIWGRVSDENEGKVDWIEVMKFGHSNVNFVDFSPCENYLITFNGTEPERDDKRNPRALIIWDILTGKKKRGFLGPPASLLGPDGTVPWPIFQWSHDDKFFARLNENVISVYQTPDMGLVGKKSIKVPHIRNFAWSPTDNIMAYWTPEVNDAPARVTLIELPSKKEIRQKALFSVSSIILHWQQEGKFLCCKVDRLTKSKKGQFTNFELFRVKAKDIPVEVLDYKEKDIVNAFGWEPRGHRFAVIHGYSDRPGRTDVSFFTMEGESGKLKQLFTLENKSVNQIRWSPKGRFVLLASIGKSGSLEWYDVNDAASREEPEAISTNEHFSCNEIHWDPSGRFVATAVTCWLNSNENGYAIWTLTGKELARVSVDKLYEFSWRPRPPTLLSSKQQREVKKTLKSRRERYEREDKDLRDSVSSGHAAKRKAQRDAFYEFQRVAQQHIKEEKEKRRKIREIVGGTEDDLETITEVVETVISVTTEVDRTKKLLTSDDERD